MSLPQTCPIRDMVFISWSRAESKAFAKVFFEWLRDHIPTLLVYFSERDIEGGTEWKEQVLSGLNRSRVVVAFLTNESVNHSRWMEAEATSVRFCGADTRVYPILIDIGLHQLPTNSGWAKLHDDLPYRQWRSFDHIWATINEISKYCGVPLASDIESKVGGLLESWEEVKKRYPKAESPGPISVINAFKNDSEFADWAYQYHRIIHHARDVTVHVLERGSSLEDPDSVLQKTLPLKADKTAKPKPHPAMKEFKEEIEHLLQILERVFRDLFQGSGAKIWICLRDLRSDEQYHNFRRTTGFPSEGRDAHSQPWHKDGKTIQTVRKTTEPPQSDKNGVRDVQNKSGRNCTIITEPGKPCWPPSLDGWTDPHRKQSILGAVLLKKIVEPDEEPRQGTMWWVLCVNSDKPGVFTEAHQRLLQGCNDAFSVVANAMLLSYRQKEA